jgi:hypothetical protein
MAGLVPATYAFLVAWPQKWVPATSAGMTQKVLHGKSPPSHAEMAG